MSWMQMDSHQHNLLSLLDAYVYILLMYVYQFMYMLTRPFVGRELQTVQYSRAFSKALCNKWTNSQTFLSYYMTLIIRIKNATYRYFKKKTELMSFLYINNVCLSFQNPNLQ